jgi:hypothetical protein
MRPSYTCYDCGGYDVFESMLVRINRLACILDDEEDLRGINNPLAWCDSCESSVVVIEARKPLYEEV